MGGADEAGRRRNDSAYAKRCSGGVAIRSDTRKGSSEAAPTLPTKFFHDTCVCVYECVCEREREKEKEKKGGRERGRKSGRKRVFVCVCGPPGVSQGAVGGADWGRPTTPVQEQS